MSQSSNLSRYKPAVIVLTGAAALACAYALYSTYNSEPPAPVKATPLRRSNAVSRGGHPSRRQHHDLRVEGSWIDRPDAPLGMVRIIVNGTEHLINIASERVPTDEQFMQRYGVPINASFRTALGSAIAACFYDACNTAARNEEEGPVHESFPELTRLLRLCRESDAHELRDEAPGIAQSFLQISEEDAMRGLNIFFVILAGSGETDLLGLERYERMELVDSITASDSEPSQGLKGLLYHIAEADAHRKAYEHRGITCDGCSEYPIRGVRWRCLNCAGFDLCSTCESSVLHYSTHVFAKVKIPLPTTSWMHPQASWYPGHIDPKTLGQHLDSPVKERLQADYDHEEAQLDALYDQFTTLCNVSLANDPTQIGRAIDYYGFTKALTSERWEHRYKPNIHYDRMFAFYDTDRNDLIGFEEFVSGMAYLRGPKRFQSLRRALQGFDADGDGSVDRYDFIRMFRAKHEIQKLQVNDMIQAQEEERTMGALDVLRSSQPISAMFRDEDIPRGGVRLTSGKAVDQFGDLQPTPGTKTILEDDEGWPDVNEGRTRRQLARQAPHQRLQAHLSRSEEILSSTDGAQDHRNGVVAIQHGPNANIQLPPPNTNGADTPAQARIGEVDEPLDHDVLWQLAEEGFHEMLDPLFEIREKANDMVIATRQDRVKWRKQVKRAAMQMEQAHQELKAGAEVDPLMATAMSAHDDASQELKRTREEVANIQSQKVPRMVPTDPENLSRLEEEIVQKPLEDLLETSGYGLLDERDPRSASRPSDGSLGNDEGPVAAGPSTSSRRSRWDGPCPSAPTTSSNKISDDPTMPQNRPNGIVPTTVLGEAKSEAVSSPASTGASTPAASETEEPPPTARLRLLAHHVGLDEAIKARGGPGRLSYEEIEEIVEADASKELRGLVVSWLELASF